MERIDAVAVPAVPALALDAEIKVHRLLGLQVRIADPVVAKTRAFVTHRSTRIHLPAVVQLAHARLRIACAEVHLEALVRLAADIVRHANIERRMCAEEIAVVNAQNRRENRVLIKLPCVLQEDVLLLDFCRTNALFVLLRIVYFLKSFSTPLECMSIHRLSSRFRMEIHKDRHFRTKYSTCQIAVFRIIHQFPAECCTTRCNICRRIGGLIPILQKFFIRELRHQVPAVCILMSIPFIFIIIFRYTRRILCHRIVTNTRCRCILPCIEVLVVIPRVNASYVRVRRVLQAAALALFLRIAQTVGQQVTVAHLRVCRCLEAPLAMLDIVDVIEDVRTNVAAVGNVRGQCRVVFVHLRIVEVDLPIGVSRASRIRQAIGVAIERAPKMMLRRKK